MAACPARQFRDADPAVLVVRSSGPAGLSDEPDCFMAGMGASMTDDTAISYQAAARGTPVLSSTGTQIGTLEHVLEVPEVDVFDGIVIATEAGLRNLSISLRHQAARAVCGEALVSGRFFGCGQPLRNRSGCPWQAAWRVAARRPWTKVQVPSCTDAGVWMAMGLVVARRWSHR